MMGDTVRVIEIVSYALIVLLGARLLWVKGRGFFTRCSGQIGTETRRATTSMRTDGHAS